MTIWVETVEVLGLPVGTITVVAESAGTSI
jgi:hypothetical protein